MTHPPDLLIRNAHAIDPASGLDGVRDLLLERGRIAAVEAPRVLPDAAEELDAGGLIVSPGLIDLHVHLREPGQTHKETIASGTRAAAAGGFTTVVLMPNTLPVNDSVETLRWMLSPERNPHVHLRAMPAATIGSLGETLTDYEALAEAGGVGFTDDGRPVIDERVMRAALVVAARLGLPISQHAENTHVSPSSGVNHGPVAFRLGLRGMTVEAESSIVERDIRLLREIERAEKLRPHLHVQHVSTGKALQAIREAKAEGLHVTGEAAPHHFTLTDEALLGFDTNCKMNPPLRAEADRLAVIEALLDGTLDCIATDHAPHALHEKEVEFERAPNGVTGLETALGLALRVLHREHGMSVARVLGLMSTGPARLIGMTDRGSLKPGSYADLVLFDPGAAWTYSAQASRSRSKNSPFDGYAMLGQVVATISHGRVVHSAGRA